MLRFKFNLYEMKSIQLLITGVLILFVVSSCVVEKVNVGNYQESSSSKVLKKGKDIYLFWDLVSMQKTEPGIDIPDYEKIVKRNLFDVVATYGTAGIFSFYTVTIRTNKEPLKKSDLKTNPENE